MGEYAVRARFETKGAPDRVLRWLTSTDGIAGWWSDRVQGEAGATGARFQVSFPTSPVDFELEVRRSDGEVVEWHVPENPPWWKGTTIRFEISPGDEGGSSLLFTHTGFEPGDPLIEVITPAWVRFLDNLVQVAESGIANPAVVN